MKRNQNHDRSRRRLATWIRALRCETLEVRSLMAQVEGLTLLCLRESNKGEGESSFESNDREMFSLRTLNSIELDDDAQWRDMEDIDFEDRSEISVDRTMATDWSDDGRDAFRDSRDFGFERDDNWASSIASRMMSSSSPIADRSQLNSRVFSSVDGSRGIVTSDGRIQTSGDLSRTSTSDASELRDNRADGGQKTSRTAPQFGLNIRSESSSVTVVPIAQNSSNSIRILLLPGTIVLSQADSRPDAHSSASNATNDHRLESPAMNAHVSAGPQSPTTSVAHAPSAAEVQADVPTRFADAASGRVAQRASGTMEFAQPSISIQPEDATVAVQSNGANNNSATQSTNVNLRLQALSSNANKADASAMWKNDVRMIVATEDGNWEIESLAASASDAVERAVSAYEYRLAKSSVAGSYRRLTMPSLDVAVQIPEGMMAIDATRIISLDQAAPKVYAGMWPSPFMTYQPFLLGDVEQLVLQVSDAPEAKSAKLDNDVLGAMETDQHRNRFAVAIMVGVAVLLNLPITKARAEAEEREAGEHLGLGNGSTRRRKNEVD